jgi:hypothetical protein
MCEYLRTLRNGSRHLAEADDARTGISFCQNGRFEGAKLRVWGRGFRTETSKRKSFHRQQKLTR